MGVYTGWLSKHAKLFTPLIMRLFKFWFLELLSTYIIPILFSDMYYDLYTVSYVAIVWTFIFSKRTTILYTAEVVKHMVLFWTFWCIILIIFLIQILKRCKFLIFSPISAGIKYYIILRQFLQTYCATNYNVNNK